MKYPCQRWLSRRGFLLGAGAGLAGTLGSGCTGPKPSVPVAKLPDGMPGPFPGRVIEVKRADAVSAESVINPQAVSAMVERGMKELTRCDSKAEAWSRLFNKHDVVGVKVNPVGNNGPGQKSISTHELVTEVVEGLELAGVQRNNIILFERYLKAFREAGYHTLAEKLGTRGYASSYEYDHTQVDIEGFDGEWAKLRNEPEHQTRVIGYDPDQSIFMGFSHSSHSKDDDRRFRSHLSRIVSDMVTKIVNLPVLKDHGSAGVTLALKNMSHGFFNNVCRSHIPRVTHGDVASGPNQCNVFIPTVLTHPMVRQKVVLHIMDGLIGVFQGGPFNAKNCTWTENSLFFATDPVAMDRIGWERVDAKRLEKGLPLVAQTGLQFGHRESFDRRQPEHIILAGINGLGEFNKVDHKRIDLTSA